MVAERDTPATAAAPLTAQLSGPPPRHKLAWPLSGGHCDWAVEFSTARRLENTAAQRYCSAVIAEREVGTAESMPPFAELVPLSAVYDRSAGKELISDF